jgi:hypothetical protein
MPKDNVHYGGWEHRDVHNINGMLYVRFRNFQFQTLTFPKSNTTYNGILERSNPPKRPFVLTRSFFAGSQRAGAMWTGDNMGTWEHMAVGIKMVLANGIAGMAFVGCKPFLGSHWITLISTPSPSGRRRFLWQPWTRDARALVSSWGFFTFLSRSCAHRHEAPRAVPS